MSTAPTRAADGNPLGLDISPEGTCAALMRLKAEALANPTRAYAIASATVGAMGAGISAASEGAAHWITTKAQARAAARVAARQAELLERILTQALLQNIDGVTQQAATTALESGQSAWAEKMGRELIHRVGKDTESTLSYLKLAFRDHFKKEISEELLVNTREVLQKFYARGFNATEGITIFGRPFAILERARPEDWARLIREAKQSDTFSAQLKNLAQLLSGEIRSQSALFEEDAVLAGKKAATAVLDSAETCIIRSGAGVTLLSGVAAGIVSEFDAGTPLEGEAGADYKKDPSRLLQYNSAEVGCRWLKLPESLDLRIRFAMMADAIKDERTVVPRD